MKKLVPAFLTFFLLFSASAQALKFPDRPASRVNDYAGMFSPAAREKLEPKLEAFEKETSNQLVIVTFQNLDGLPIEDVSMQLAEKWKIGTKEHDNGVILLFAKEARAMRIEVGYGLEGVLPDALAKRIIQNEITPSFKQGDFDGGLERGVDAILAATRGEYKGETSPEDPIGHYKEWLFLLLVLYLLVPILCYILILVMGPSLGGFAGFVFSISAVVVLVSLRALFASSAGKTYSGRNRGRWYSGGGYGGGFSGGGGFGGGGGGSFGGGGASGRW